MRTEEELKDRFQYQKWYIKLWRYRYYLLIPYRAIIFWWHKPWDHKRDWWGFKIAWKIEIGMAQGKMKWYWTLEEVKKRLDRQQLIGCDEDGNCEVLKEKHNDLSKLQQKKRD